MYDEKKMQWCVTPVVYQLRVKWKFVIFLRLVLDIFNRWFEL